jgi:hypothetical protein
MVSVRAQTNPSDLLSEAEKFMQDVVEDSSSAAPAPLNVSPSDLSSQRDQALKQVSQTPLLQNSLLFSKFTVCTLARQQIKHLIALLKYIAGGYATKRN